MLFATLRPTEPWLRDYMISKGVPTYSCECRSRGSYALGMLRLARYLHAEQVDILHTHLFDPSVIGLCSGVLARTPIRVMTRHHSNYHSRINKRCHVQLDRMCTRLSDAVVAVSRHTAEHMIETERAPASKIHIVLNGIDFDRVRVSDSQAPGRVRSELGAEDKHLIVVLGRLHPEKGYEQLFAALPMVRSAVRRRILVSIAGEGPFRAAYEAEVRRLGCSDIVRFLGHRTDAADLIAAADLLVLPSVAEAFGFALVEALYLGTPVVASRVGGIPEIVDDGVDGVLVPPGDSVALGNAIAQLLEDPEWRSKMARAGTEKIKAKFRFEEMVRGYEALYERLEADPARRVLRRP